MRQRRTFRRIRGPLLGKSRIFFGKPLFISSVADYRLHQRATAGAIAIVETLAGGDDPSLPMRILDEGRLVQGRLIINHFRNQNGRIFWHGCKIAVTGIVGMDWLSAHWDEDR